MDLNVICDRMCSSRKYTKFQGGQVLRQNIIVKFKYEEVKGGGISNEKTFSVGGGGVGIISGPAQLSITASKLFLSS